ncbi:pleckstrin homology domain-containing family G member 6-like, partial [Mobula birostris]|uniref:pleckstrin homology domain-containing family G member 6-like n=1 Tax=Mobula birostris TaxID=1983395 RepID=UPI003B2845F1
MLPSSARSWDVPVVMEGKSREAEGPPEEEAVDPGPLGLVAARIRLFDNSRLHAWEGPGRSAYPRGQGTKERRSRTLGHQESGRVQKLTRNLAVYSMFGLPRLPEGLRRLWAVGEGLNDSLSPQSSWRDFVPGHEALSRQQRHLQESMWELIQTEVAYLRNLGIVTDLFLAGLLNLQASGLLLDVSPGCMFSNLPDIVRAHHAFWREALSPFLAQSRQSGQLDPVQLNQAFSTFPSRFECYWTYCLSEGSCLSYTHQTQADNPLFAIYVKWAETHKQGHRMRLGDALVKPHQHLTRYPLLLRAVLRRVEGEAARDGISATINTIDNFIRSIDSQMHVRAEQYRLAELADSLRTYEAVDGISEEVDQ